MKKLAVILVVLSLTRIGVAYADTNNPADSQNYFFGTKSASENLNQVLALLVGPKGEPGAAGVAGKDGLIGMDGQPGADGLPGAPGAVGATGSAGPAGASVLSVAFTGAQGTCLSGGVRFTDGVGTVTYSCNGANGSNGAAGATGAAGPAGTGGGGGSGGSIGYGQGEVAVGACEADNKMSVDFTRQFTGLDFVFTSFLLGNAATDGNVSPTCVGKTLSFYFKIKTGVLSNTTGEYIAGDIVKCTHTLPSASSWPTNTVGTQFTLDSSNTLCSTLRTPSTTFTLTKVSTADYTDRIGFEIG